MAFPRPRTGLKTGHYKELPGCAVAPAASPDNYADELVDAYLFVDDADALYAEYASRGVEFARGLGSMPWRCREFVVKDCDGRLLAFGANL